MRRPSLVVGLSEQLRRESLVAALGSKGRWDVVARADGYDLLAECRRRAPDPLVLVGPSLEGLSPIEACHAIAGELPEATLVLWSEDPDPGVVLAAIEAGIAGVVGRDEGLVRLLDVLRRTAAGEVVVSPHLLGPIMKQLIARRRRSREALERYLALTPREREVLAFLAGGHDYDAIADELVVSGDTVRTHAQNMMRKLGVHSRNEAVALALDQGWIRPRVLEVHAS